MDYIIPINDLKEGRHQYNFDVDNSFFDSFPESELKQCTAHVEVELIKRSNGIEALFNLAGTVTVTCDRCLGEFSMPISNSGHLLFEPGDEPGEVTDELVVIARNESHLDLKQYIYEFISLAVPYQKYHPLDANGNSTCAPDMIARLEHMQPSAGQTTDPRWNKLKDLIN